MAPNIPKGHMWSRLRTIWRDEGARGVWFRGLGCVGYSRLLVWSRPIGEPVVAELPSGLQLIEIGPQELDRYLRFRTDQVEATARRRWQRGERCHAIAHGDAIVHCAWSATGIAWVDFLRCRLVLPHDVVYSFDAVTAAAYQRQGHSGTRAHYVTGLYGALGYSRVWSATLPENPAALRFQQRLGARPIGQLRRWPWNVGWIDRSLPSS